MSAAGIAAGASLAGSLIEARQRKKDRKAEARKEVGKAEERKGDKTSKALGGIVDNLRASLLGS